MSIDVILQERQTSLFCDIMCYKFELFMQSVCSTVHTSWTLRCLVQVSFRASWRWRLEKPSPYRAALRSSPGHRCHRIYPAPGHHVQMSRHCKNTDMCWHFEKKQNNNNSPFFWQTCPSSCLGKFCIKRETNICTLIRSWQHHSVGFKHILADLLIMKRSGVL